MKGHSASPEGAEAASHEPVLDPELVAASADAERAIARYTAPLGLALFVLGCGLAIGTWSLKWLPAWLLVGAWGLAMWREGRATRAA